MVDTSELIRDESNIFSSPLVARFLKHGQLHNMALNSPTNQNILSRIFEKKIQFRSDMKMERQLLGSSECLFPRDPDKIAKILASDGTFVTAERKMIDYILGASFLSEGLFQKVRKFEFEPSFLFLEIL